MLLSIGVFRLDWRPWPFAVEHAAKVLSFFAALVPFTAAGASFLRLLGWRPVEPMDNPFAARTPADFWRRYNRATHQFLLEDVFKPAGGARRPVRATIVTFAISALIHEYVFDVSASRIQGYQTLFFLVQGCAVAATARFRPRGPTAIPWVAATLTFNLASGVLFFASLDEIVPFYTLRAP
ncbi:MAG: MBOAT family O-acyltransferase [Isosphaeraceae bacterium]